PRHAIRRRTARAARRRRPTGRGRPHRVHATAPTRRRHTRRLKRRRHTTQKTIWNNPWQNPATQAAWLASPFYRIGASADRCLTRAWHHRAVLGRIVADEPFGHARRLVAPGALDGRRPRHLYGPADFFDRTDREPSTDT